MTSTLNSDHLVLDVTNLETYLVKVFLTFCFCIVLFNLLVIYLLILKPSILGKVNFTPLNYARSTVLIRLTANSKLYAVC